MENNELKEKLLCVLRKEAGNLKNTPYTNYYILKTNSFKIIFEAEPVFEHKTVTEDAVISPKYVWQKEKIEKITRNTREFLYNEGSVRFEGNYFKITKEEYGEILELRKKQIEERQLEELNKICNEK